MRPVQPRVASLAVALSLALLAAAPARAQPRADARPDGDRARGLDGRAPAVPGQPPAFPAMSVTHHTLALPDRSLAFTATASAQRTLDGQGAPQLEIAMIAYTLDGADPHSRPVTFVFNGGPGASSAFLQLGALGPWRLPMDGAAAAPSAPPIVRPNADTWLDFTDLVFIDPVGSGFSRFLSSNEDVRKRTWSVDGDVDLLARTIRRWLARNDRAISPKYIIGESYGGMRGPRLVRALQTGQGIGVDGLMLVSPFMDYGGRSSAFDPLTWVAHLPSMAAAAREAHGAVDRASLADVEAYAGGDYLHDLMLGLSDKAAVARIDDRVTALTGLDPTVVREHAGRIDSMTFLRESHRDQGLVGSFYDASRLAPDPFPDASFSNHSDPVTDAVRAPLTSAMLDLYARELKWLPDQPYEIENATVARNWDLGRGRPESVSALRAALALDPRFRVLIGHGLTDLVTPYFGTQILLNQIPPTDGADRVKLLVLPGGHMFYARDASRAAYREAARALVTGE